MYMYIRIINHYSIYNFRLLYKFDQNFLNLTKNITYRVINIFIYKIF